jgi:hypothetical protein
MSRLRIIGGGMSEWWMITQLCRVWIEIRGANDVEIWLCLGNEVRDEIQLECRALFAEGDLSSADICSAGMNPVKESVLGSHSEWDAQRKMNLEGGTSAGAVR